MMWGNDFGWMGWVGWSVMIIVPIAVVAIATAIAVAVARGTGGRRSAAGQPDSADLLLAERFARGEIDEEEFERRRSVLRKAGTS